MENGTSCEPVIVAVALIKHANKIDKKQKFLCLNNTDKLKKNWSEGNYIKL